MKGFAKQRDAFLRYFTIQFSESQPWRDFVFVIDMNRKPKKRQVSKDVIRTTDPPQYQKD